MTASPTLQWSSAVQDILACARGRLPAAFLSRRLADLGLGEVPPLPREDLARFEQAVDLVNLLASGRPAPAGVKPDQAMAAAFPDDHATLGKLRPLAQAHLSSLRPAKAPGRKPEEARAPEREARHDRPERRPMRDDRGPMRDDRGPRRDDRRGDYGDRREPRATPPPRPPRVSWEQYLAMHFGSPAPVVPAPAPAAEPAAPVAEGAAAAEGAAPAPAPAVVPPAPVVPALAPVLPPSLAAWSVDGDAKRQLARIRDRVVQVATKPAEQELAPLVRELAFAILRPPLGVRDDLRLMIAEHLGRLGIAVSVAALHPPPPVAALRRDWEGLLAARGPDDAAVAQAWKKLIEAHPEARGKLEAEREHERTELVKRFAQSLREHGDEAPQTAELRSRLLARVAGAAAVVEAETARWKAAAEAAATCGKLIAERGWGHPEVAAAIAACEAADPGAAGRFEQQRRHEREELERRFRNALRQGGPDHETVTAAIAHLSERFPAEGAAAAARRERARRGEDLSQQEQARREAGKSLSEVHLGSAEHRPWLLRAAPRWRLVVSVTGARQREGREPKDGAREGGRDGKEQAKEGERPRRGGHAVALLVPGAVEGGLVPAGFRAPECGRLDELDAAFQAVLDRPWGVVGLALSDCPDRGAGAWGDAAAALAALVSATLPVEGRCELALELPAWAEADAGQLAALDRALAAGGSRIAVARTTGGDDAAAALAEALCWTWGGKRDSETARLRQSGLAGSCFLQPSPAVRDTLARLGEGALPGWNALSALQVEAAGDANGAAAALLARCGERLAADAESATALHRHLAGQARGRIAEPARLARELAWFEITGGTLLRAKERLRHDGAVLAVQAAEGRIDPAASERLVATCAALREDYPAEVLDAALAAAALAREALDLPAAAALIEPWARAEAVACGGRANLVRVGEERARQAAASGRWKDARRHLERADEIAGRMADQAERSGAQARIACLRAAVVADDATVSDDEARGAVAAAVGASDLVAEAARLAVAGAGAARHAHHALLRAAVRRQDEVVLAAYTDQRTAWCEGKEAPFAQIALLRAVALAAGDAPAAATLLADAAARLGGDQASPATRLAVAAATLAAIAHGLPDPGLAAQLTALRRRCPAATAAVEALERAATLLPDRHACLAEALPLLLR